SKSASSRSSSGRRLADRAARAAVAVTTPSLATALLQAEGQLRSWISWKRIEGQADQVGLCDLDPLPPEFVNQAGQLQVLVPRDPATQVDLGFLELLASVEGLRVLPGAGASRLQVQGSRLL